MRETTPAHRLLLISVAVFVICLLSYSVNLFHTASPTVLANADPGPDRLVTDALTAGEPTLGLSGARGFSAYPSQYGAQLAFYRFIGVPDSLPLSMVPYVNAGLMSVVVALMTWLVGVYLFSGKGALAFGLTLALSPLMVAFASSFYWMTWAWYLPFIISLAMGERLFRRSGLLIAAGLWFVVLMWRDLCGYEYASTIALAGAAPIVFLGLRRGFSLVKTAVPCAVLGGVSVLALLAAFTFHADRFASGTEGGFGWKQIALVAGKRIGSHSSVSDLREACLITPGVAILEGEGKQKQVDACIGNLQRAQQAPLLVVLATYLTYRRTVPYLAGPDLIDDPSLTAARVALRRLDFRALQHSLRGNVVGRLTAIVTLPLTALIVWGGITITGLTFRREMTKCLPTVAMLAVSFLAPFSWYVLAKAHSYGHFHLNFILWNLPFLPLLVAVLFERICKYGQESIG